MQKNIQKTKVTIIGAGLGGLAVACRLARMGFQVLVLEQSKSAGGKAGSLTIPTKKGDFRFDTGPSLMTMREVFEDLFEFCEQNLEDYLDLEELSISTKYFFEDGSVIVSYKDRQLLLDEIKNKVGIEPSTVLKYLNRNQKIYELTKQVFLDDEIGPKTLLKPKFWEGVLNINTLSPYTSMHNQNQSTLKDYRLVQIADRYATFNGSNPYQAPATLNVIAHLDLSLPTYFPRQGIYEITKAILNLAQKMGVEIVYNSKVLSIQKSAKSSAVGLITNPIKKESIEGVWVSVDHNESLIFGKDIDTLDSDNNQNSDFDNLNKNLENSLDGGGGRRFIKTDFLISNVDILTTYLDLSDDADYSGVKKRLKQEFSSSTLVYYWAINRDSQDLDVHNILFSSDYKKEFEDIFEGLGIGQDPTIYIHIGSKIDKESAPTGCESWFVMINVGADKSQNWQKLASDWKPIVYQKINRLVLGKNGDKAKIQDLILGERVLTPDMVAKKTGSYRGSLYGLASNNPFSAFQRYPNQSKKYSNLYFVGGSTHPGGGMPLVLNSAKIVTQKISKLKK